MFEISSVLVVRSTYRSVDVRPSPVAMVMNRFIDISVFCSIIANSYPSPTEAIVVVRDMVFCLTRLLLLNTIPSVLEI